MPRSESRPRSRRVRRATDGRRGPARPKFGSKSAREKTSGETRGWRLSRPREIGRLGRRPPVLRKPSRAPALSQTGVLVSLSLCARRNEGENERERETRAGLVVGILFWSEKGCKKTRLRLGALVDLVLHPRLRKHTDTRAAHRRSSRFASAGARSLGRAQEKGEGRRTCPT